MFKKILLKVSAFAMACTLIGTGAAYTNSTANTTGKSFSIEADAAPWIFNEGNISWTLCAVGKVVLIRTSRTEIYTSKKGYIYVYKSKSESPYALKIFIPESPNPIYKPHAMHAEALQ